MKVATAAEMREIDRRAIEEYGIPGQTLMERAGSAVASRAANLFPGKKAIALCGGGNNGGDGLVAVRDLLGRGYEVKALMLADPAKLSSDCKIQLLKAKDAGVPCEFRRRVEKTEFEDAFVIDAIFGTGLAKPITGDLADTIRNLNESDAPALAVDIASGISSDTGQSLGEAVLAEHTVTFGLPKRGHFLYPGARHSGCLYVEDIGFPAELTGSGNIETSLIYMDVARGLIPERPRNSYKGDYGHILVVAGSRGKTGAALMTAMACLRSGSGLVTIAVPESLMDIFQSRVTEEMLIALPDKGDGSLSRRALDRILEFAGSRADVIAIGPGIGVSPDTTDLMRRLVLSSPAPLVIDADGLNSLADARKTLGMSKAPVIITPHPGEMARMLNQAPPAKSTKQKKADLIHKMSVDDIERDRIGIAMSFALETGACTVLKGVPTIIADASGHACINTSGNPGMATAGSGDVLTGVIASFVGQGVDTVSASALGVYMHGLAGDLAAKDKGEYSLVASDIISALPAAFNYIA